MKSLHSSAARLAVLGGICSLLPAVAAAQSMSSAAPPAGSGQTASDDGFSDIIVTARRREEALQSVPVSITAITPAQLREKAINDPYDLTMSVPGLNVRVGGATRETPDYFIRGQGNTFSCNPGVLVYFNEVPLGSLNPNLQSAAANLMIFEKALDFVARDLANHRGKANRAGGASLHEPQALPSSSSARFQPNSQACTDSASV